MSVTVPPHPASPAMPSILPPIAAVTSPSLAERLIARMRVGMRDPVHRARFMDGASADPMLTALLVDDIAAVIGSDGGWRRDPRTGREYWAWRIGDLELRGTVPASASTLDAIADAIVARLVEADVSVDAEYERGIARAFAERFTAFRTPVIGILADLNRLSWRQPVNDSPLVARSKVALREAAARLVVLEAFYADLFACANRPEPVMPSFHDRYDLHFREGSNREIDTWFCRVMRDQYAALIGALQVLQPEIAELQPVRCSIDGQPVLVWELGDLEWRARDRHRDLTSRVAAMRIRFGEYDLTVRDRLMAMFVALPVTADTLMTLGGTVRAEAREMLAQARDMGAADAREIFGDDLSFAAHVETLRGTDALRAIGLLPRDSVLLESIGNRLSYEDEPTAVPSTKQAVYVDRLLRRQALIDSVTEVQTNTVLTAAIGYVDDLEANLMESVFAATPHLPPAETLARLTTPEGWLLAKAIVLADAVHLDRCERASTHAGFRGPGVTGVGLGD